MSSGQLRTWFVEQLTEGITANNLHLGLRLSGKLDTAALELSLKLVTDRHEALRAVFDVRNGEPVQQIRQLPSVIETINVPEGSALERERAAYAIALREVHRPFDLKQGPLFRLILLRLSPEIHIMLCVFHHIICDNWSLGVFARELSECYLALCGGTKPELKLLPAQYSDYVSRQRQWIGSEDFARQLSYWTGKLAGARPLLDIMAAGTRPAKQSFAGASQARRLSQPLLLQIKSVATKHNATPFTVCLAVLKILLRQYSGETDILVGIPVAGRAMVDWEDVIGHFANLVVVRTDLSEDLRFSDLLRRVRDGILDALTNQDVPFERLVQSLHPSRNLAANPIFQVLCTSLNAAAPSERFGGLQASPYAVEAKGAPFDLSLSVIEESPDGGWIRGEYRTDLFSHDQIARFLDHYVNLLESVLARADARLSELEKPPNWLPHPGPGSRRTNSQKVDLAQPCPSTEAGRASGPVEETLERLWAEVLGARPPGITANFFDLGGHSLMAVRLIAEIGRVFGTKLPVSLLFQHPTIEALACRLRGEIGGPSAVIPICKEGARAPLFFAGPMRREFEVLSRALGPDQPFFHLDIFALQERRLAAGQALYSSVPALAACFRSDILSIQPAGPYFLGGMCDGGVIAFELALQLQSEGHEVALLAQFDTPVRGYWHKRPGDWLRHGYALLSSGRLPSRAYSKARQNIARRPYMTPEEKQFAEIWKVIWRAVRAYYPDRLFEGEIQIFRGPQPPTYFYEGVVAGWTRRASQGIRVHDVFGDHVGIFLDPASQHIIARTIEQAYRDAAAK
jgi:thioesterase domain-containing protein